VLKTNGEPKKFCKRVLSKLLWQKAQKPTLNGLDFLAQWQNFHHTGRKILPGVATLEDAAVGAG
jgi:hypothetical protein